MRRFLKRLQGRLSLALARDTAFIETAFREILGRNPDLDGLNHSILERIANEPSTAMA